MAGKLDSGHQTVASPGLPDVLDNDLADVLTAQEIEERGFVLRAGEDLRGGETINRHRPGFAGVNGGCGLREAGHQDSQRNRPSSPAS